MNLREHQRQDINRIREAFAEHRRVLYVLPTGAGKTVVAVALIRAWVKQGKRVLFLAHRRELIHQAYDQLVAAGVPKKHLGVLMAFDERANPRAMVQVASVATLNRRTTPEADVVVVDEAHHAVTSSYSRVMKALPEAQVLGLTATPVRLDGKGLARAFDVLALGAKSSELIAAGHLAEIETWTVPDELLPELKTVKVIAGDYQLNELATVMTRRQLVGGLVDHWKRHAEGRATVVFATTIEHARVIRDAFESAGVKAEHVDMSTPREERDGILERLASGETQVITNCAVLLEGWDAPQIKCVMMARPTMSLALYLQMAGRCVRPWRDSAPVLLDHAGNAVMHGPPQEDHEWELAQTKRKRGAARKHMARACPECQRVLPLLAKACPCGHEFRIEEPPEEVEGELVRAEASPLCGACGKRSRRHVRRNAGGVALKGAGSLDHVASRLGTGISTIGSWRAGRRLPEQSARELIFSEFGIPPRDWDIPAADPDGLCKVCASIKRKQRAEWRRSKRRKRSAAVQERRALESKPLRCAICECERERSTGRANAGDLCASCAHLSWHHPDWSPRQIVEHRRAKHEAERVRQGQSPAPPLGDCSVCKLQKKARSNAVGGFYADPDSPCDSCARIRGRHPEWSDEEIAARRRQLAEAKRNNHCAKCGGPKCVNYVGTQKGNDTGLCLGCYANTLRSPDPTCTSCGGRRSKPRKGRRNTGLCHQCNVKRPREKKPASPRGPLGLSPHNPGTW